MLLHKDSFQKHVLLNKVNFQKHGFLHTGCFLMSKCQKCVPPLMTRYLPPAAKWTVRNRKQDRNAAHPKNLPKKQQHPSLFPSHYNPVMQSNDFLHLQELCIVQRNNNHNNNNNNNSKIYIQDIANAAFTC